MSCLSSCGSRHRAQHHLIRNRQSLTKLSKNSNCTGGGALRLPPSQLVLLYEARSVWITPQANLIRNRQSLAKLSKNSQEGGKRSAPPLAKQPGLVLLYEARQVSLLPSGEVTDTFLPDCAR